MKKSVGLSSLLTMLLFGLATPAQAGNAVADVDVHLSTLGYGAEVALPLSENFAARLGLNQFSKSFSKSVATTITVGGVAQPTTISYAGNLKLATTELLVDWHPFSGVTHITAGLMLNNNKFEVTGSEQLTNATVHGEVTFKKTAPYLGIGWSGRASQTGFSFKSDFGILFQGSPMATLSSTDPVLNQQLATEQANLNNSLSSFKRYPVISIGLGYAF